VTNSSSEIGLSVVRKAIEEHVSKEDAPTVLFEALSELPEGEDIPRTLGALTIFIAGPLSKILRQHLGAEEGAKAVEKVKLALTAGAVGIAPAPATPSDIEVSVSDSDWPDIVVDEQVDVETREEDAEKRPTLVMAGEESVGDAVRVMVVARTARLAQRIRAAFGGHRVSVSFSGRIADCSERLEQFAPSIVIVDGQDAADIRPVDLAQVLTDSPEAVLVLVWASDQPWGSAAVSSLKNSGATFAPVPRSAGVEPMLDYIRARFG